MGAVYNEGDELDFTFLQRSTRQQSRGGAETRKRGSRTRVNDSSRDQMANLVSDYWQKEDGGGRSGQAGESRRQIKAQERRRPVQEVQMQGRQAGVTRTRDSQLRGPRTQSSQVLKPRTQNRQGKHIQSHARQTSAPQTMQEKQKQRQAALIARKKRRLRRQKQLLAILLGILLAGSGLAILQLQQMEKNPEVEMESGGQSVTSVQAEGASEDFVWGTVQGIPESQYNQHPNWTENYLTISEYSRPGEPLEEVKNIFVHYTANLNTSAAQNRSYFENLKDNHDVPGASAHFIIGIEGEILQIVPLDEVAYAVQTRNQDSISIECCYKYENGQFTQETYDSLIELLAWLVNTYELEPEDILRHYDCGGKKCPLYYVDHEDAWRILKQDVGKRVALMQ